MQFPRLLLVRQNFPNRGIPDIAAEVRQQLSVAGFAGRLKPNARVAIGVGSRGIHHLAPIVRNVVQYWKDEGMRPIGARRSEEHTSELQSRQYLVCRLL